MAEKKKRRIWDKVVMGAIIGGAIGSVIGGAAATKKEQSIVKEKASKGMLRKVLGIFKKKQKETSAEIKEIPNEMEEEYEEYNK